MKKILTAGFLFAILLASGVACGSSECYTCTDLEAECGTHDDGCGNLIECGSCDCGHDCENGVCTLPGCLSLGVECGSWELEDSCDPPNVVECGTCEEGFECDNGQCVPED